MLTEPSARSFLHGVIVGRPPLVAPGRRRYGLQGPIVLEYVYRQTPYDSRFEPPRGSGWARLTLIVRVCLQPYVPDMSGGLPWALAPDHGGTLRKVVPWDTVSDPAERFPAWVARWTREIRAVWHARLWLTGRSPTHDYPLVPVHCRLDLRTTSTPAHSHFFIRVRRLHESETSFQSDMRVGGGCKAIVDDGMLDHLDLEPKPVTGQLGAVHEFGHYLGLNHVAYGSDTPYGNNPYQRGDIMGAGTRLEGWHAWPWKHRLRLHQTFRPPMNAHPPGVEWTGTTVRPG